jgi:hypothetical protein
MTLEQAKAYLRFKYGGKTDQVKISKLNWIFYINYWVYPSELETHIDKDGVKTVWQTYFIPKGADTIRQLNTPDTPI